MSTPMSLSPQEIRVIKMDKKAILELLGEIFNNICHKKLQLPHNKTICFDWFFDSEKCEIMLFAYKQMSGIKKENIIEYINNLSIQVTQSLLESIEGKKYYCTIRNIFSTNFSVSNTFQLFRDSENWWEPLFAKIGIHSYPLKQCEVRIIRLPKEAIDELLWEHFMQTGNKVMDIPEEDSDDFRIIYHFIPKENLEELMLYVMNINEANDEAFIKNSTYCEENIPITTNSYSKVSKKPKYISVIIKG